MGLSPKSKSWSSLVKIKKEEGGQVYFKDLVGGQGIVEVNDRATLLKHVLASVDTIFPAPAPAPKTAKKSPVKGKGKAKKSSKK